MTIYIIALVIALLTAFACYMLVSQYAEKQRVQKQRLLMALKTKQRNIAHMLSGFPPYFLPDDLVIMVYDAMIDICEQLQTMEPDNDQHSDEISHLNKELHVLTTNKPAQRVIADAQQQLKIRQHLQELHDFVAQQEILKLINSSQSLAYQEQISGITFQMLIDENIGQAKEAQQAGKTRLAIHHFTLAKEQLAAENSDNSFDKQIVQLDILIKKLETELANDPEASADPAETNATLNREWEKFNKNADAANDWQKKQVYD